MEWNLTEGDTDGLALRAVEINCANPRYGMSCVPQIPYAHRPNHMTPLTNGPYSRQKSIYHSCFGNFPQGSPVGPRRNSSPDTLFRRFSRMHLGLKKAAKQYNVVCCDENLSPRVPELRRKKIRFTKSERGSDKLIYLGYLYTRLRENKNGVVWRCDMLGGCNATVTLSEDGSSVIKEPSEHKNHSADWGRIKAKECVENMKERAETSREPTSVIIQNELQRIASEANVNLPKKSSIKKTVRRATKLHLPPEPRNVDELNVIADRYTKTVQGERWLLYFEAEDNVKFIILYLPLIHV
ncbi:hypothetical protein ANN_05292 [Periplaneta americana]|uniref:FLYWCH-type domain-containing protein n=1 Tax=Periplaneta americana TaxID=6978 RepID=A0ABQ8TBL9_PERAM|nr:hypothetical protein ANN_05292 [Periplaneta americana]